MYILKSLSLMILIFFFFSILFNGCCTYMGYTQGFKADVRNAGEIEVYTDIRDVEYNLPVTVFCENDTVSGIYEGVARKSVKLRRTDWVDSTQHILRENINKIQVTTPIKKTYRTLGTIIGLTCDTILLWLISDLWGKSFNPVSLDMST